MILPDKLQQLFHFTLHDELMLLFNIPIYAIFIPLEIILSNFNHLKFYSIKETITNIYLNLLNAGIDFLLRILVSLTVLNFFY